MQNTILTEKLWDKTLLHQLLGDLGAAIASATLVTPAVTIIDRALVEKSLLNRPLIHGLRKHSVAALKSPSRFISQVPFRIIWALYAATFTVANGTDSICNRLEASATGLITFATTTLVNVPLGVWKDIRFAQIFGVNTKPDGAETLRPIIVQSRGATKAAAAIFLIRDGVTIFGSFTLAPRLSSMIPDDYTASHHQAKPVISQLTVPVLSQLVATPLHLLGLDLYTRQGVPFVDRMVQSQRYLPSATVVRCIRIIPAFGFGCLANMELRSVFHRKLNV
ncbi:uncharacterized protein N7483_006097 [Penicillium malachiteum]|uniref:uncharacterized protein n=1 Tax=Penicillium malachiteum TaxID=1324776 RepID=UPI002548DC1F|nr:uncharacterized protein N7483_006097 [Penicillium malachiteum]KAJ5731589.1 hypothetical protein N7483_006097 [Penicillium malachiteum]